MITIDYGVIIFIIYVLLWISLYIWMKYEYLKIERDYYRDMYKAEEEYSKGISEILERVLKER